MDVRSEPLDQSRNVENLLLNSPPNGPAAEQEEPAHVRPPRPRFLPPRCKSKTAIIGIVISLGLVFGLVLILVRVLGLFGSDFGLETLVPLNCQQDAIKCPPDWIGHQEHCYKFSEEEKNWKESQNFCISHKASLAKITQQEMDIVKKFARDHVFWIGLKKEPDQPWKWLDGENPTLQILGNGGDCAFLNDDGTASSGRCTTEHHYICKKY